MKTTIAALIAATAAFSAQAEYQWGFANVSTNYLTGLRIPLNKSGNSTHMMTLRIWSLRAVPVSAGVSSMVSSDLENAFNSKTIPMPVITSVTPSKPRRVSTSVIPVSTPTVSVYGTYSLPGNGGNFHEVNTLYGIGYNTEFNGYGLNRLLPCTMLIKTFYSGNNGYVLGWVAGCDFNLWNENSASPTGTKSSLTGQRPLRQRRA